MFKIPVSTGELIDKITILEIKIEKIKDEDKLDNIKREFNYLNQVINLSNIKSLYNELKEINLKLWNVEDNIRIKEKNKDFDREFIELARSVYTFNDRRSDIKKQINILTSSELVEEKSYEEY